MGKNKKNNWYDDWSYETVFGLSPHTILRLPNIADGFLPNIVIDHNDATQKVLWELLQSALMDLTNDNPNNPS